MLNLLDVGNMEAVSYTTKQDLNKALKAIGLQAPKSRINSFKDVSHRGFKGIRGGSIGPMTATDAYRKHNRDVEQKAIDLLRTMPGIGTIGVSDEGIRFSLNDGKKIHNYRFIWTLFQTYAHNEYDPSYRTYWLTLQQL